MNITVEPVKLDGQHLVAVIMDGSATNGTDHTSMLTRPRPWRDGCCSSVAR